MNVVFPNKVLTVVIRNDSPMINCGDSPSYRTVRIDLTDKQLHQLALQKIGENRYEAVSQCILEQN